MSTFFTPKSLAAINAVDDCYKKCSHHVHMFKVASIVGDADLNLMHNHHIAECYKKCHLLTRSICGKK
jgi:hypothetical protein